MITVEWPRNPGSKGERIYEANYCLLTISIYGRRFFYRSENNQVACFEMTIDGKLWLRDEHTNKRVYVAYQGRWRHFSNGGTLRALVEALARYIRTGEPIRPGHFGPWPDWYCGGDLWGYGADTMAGLRNALRPRKCIAWPARLPSSTPRSGGEVSAQRTEGQSATRRPDAEVEP